MQFSCRVWGTFTIRKSPSHSTRFVLDFINEKNFQNFHHFIIFFYILATYDLSSYNLTYEIYKSSLDLALYSNSEFWLDITKALWKMYMSPFEVKKNYQYPCSWSEIMTGDYPAIYFTKLWSQVS